jgi:hypothetical protein
MNVEVSDKELLIGHDATTIKKILVATKDFAVGDTIYKARIDSAHPLVTLIAFTSNTGDSCCGSA